MLALESAVLSEWYRSRPEVRRLLAIRDKEGLRVLLQLEPAQDSSEMNPAWTANHTVWTDELQCHTGSPVRLEHMDERDESDETDGDTREVIVVDLFWRDPSLE